MQLIWFRKDRAALGKNTAVHLMLRKSRREAAKIRLVRMKARKDIERRGIAGQITHHYEIQEVLNVPAI